VSALTTKRTAKVVPKIATNIQGKNPVGVTAANTNPVTIGGVDGDNKIKGFSCEEDPEGLGVQRVTIAAYPYFSLANEVNKAVTAATDILTTDYTATESGISVLMISTNTAGILSLEVDSVVGQLNGGTNLDIGKWYAFDVPVVEDSLYNLQFSVSATLQIKWFLGGVGNA